MTSRSAKVLHDEDFAQLLGFRDGLRRFLHWSEAQARMAGLTPARHQLLLAVRGHGRLPSISDLAEHLLLRHHSTVELVDRACHAGLIERLVDQDDQRVVRVGLTPAGEEKLAALASAHLEELSRLRPRLTALWDRLPDSS
jgi:DNA-binding MarR family transcriptional regulator